MVIDITTVLKAIEVCCVPETNVIYEHYMVNHCVQDSGETIDYYIMNMVKLAGMVD